MREVKFRAWGADSQEMINDIRIMIKYAWSVYADNDAMAEIADGDKWTLMQYTGLKDKNFKEIYEGDIVNLHCSSNKDHIVTATMEWLNDYARFIVNIHKKKILHKISGNMVSMREMHGWVGSHSCFSHQRWIEIIGNIYENPEILEA